MQNLGIDILFDTSTIIRLLNGLSVSLYIAFLSIGLAWILGTLLGVIRTFNLYSINLLSKIYLELFRFIPILVWLYSLYYLISAHFNINLHSHIVAIIIFSLWGIAEMSDIIRSTLIALPKHQTESALAIGFNKRQQYQYILLPQTIKQALPAAINLAVRMLMTTSLLFALGITDIIKVGQQIIESSSFTHPMAPFWIYGFIFIIYFIICYPLSALSKKITISLDSGKRHANA